jgi:hypothetical protein
MHHYAGRFNAGTAGGIQGVQKLKAYKKMQLLEGVTLKLSS